MQPDNLDPANSVNFYLNHSVKSWDNAEQMLGTENSH